MMINAPILTHAHVINFVGMNDIKMREVELIGLVCDTLSKAYM